MKPPAGKWPRDFAIPAFFPNLVVAGEWAGWTAEQVRDVVLRHIEAQTTVPSLVARMRRRWHQWKAAPIAQDREKVKALMAR